MTGVTTEGDLRAHPVEEDDVPLTLLVAEDIDLVGEAFVALLGTEPDFEVVSRVARGDHVLDAALVHRPDVALLDIDMPGMTGIEVCAELTKHLPTTKVVLLTALPGSGYLRRALAAGVHGYLLKTMTACQLMDSIRAVAAGQLVVDPRVAAEALRSDANPLTDRECEILTLVDQGVGTSEIAEELYLSRGTVRNYLSYAMAKLNASSRAEAARIARNRGLI